MRSKHTHRLLVLLISVAYTGSVSAAVRMTQLTSHELATQHTDLAKHGIEAGDVLLENDMIRAVILTAPSEKSPSRVGELMILPLNLNAEGAPLRVSPGPAGGWTDIEAGMVSSVAVIRMHRREERWNAELVFKLHDGSSWVDVSTVIRNTDQNEILEIPVVDEVHLPEGSKFQSGGPKTVFVDQPKHQTTFAVLSLSKSLNVRETSSRQYSLGSISEDPQPRSFLMSGFRLFGRKKPENRDRYQPVDASRDWHRSLRSNDDWHRLQPGEERSIDRKVISSVTISEAKTLAEAVSDFKAPMVQLVPSTTNAKVVAAPEASKARIVGQLRQPTAAPEPTFAPAEDAPLLEVQAEEDDFQPPAILPPSIEAIEDLPPPIED